MKFFRLFFYGLIVLIFVLPLMAQEKYQSLIKGKVVDEKGAPVANARITFDIPKELEGNKCWTKNNEVLSDKDGNFVHEEYCGLSTRTVQLYIIPTEGLWESEVLIFPPYDYFLEKNHPKFAPLSVKIEGNENIDLGALPIKVWYNEINLFVLDKKGKPFYKTDDEWSRFYYLKVRDSYGIGIGGSGLSIYDIENKVNIEKGFVKVSLPEGTWTLELLADLEDYNQRTDKTKRYLAKTVVTIKKSDPTQTVRLIVNGKK